MLKNRFLVLAISVGLGFWGLVATSSSLAESRQIPPLPAKFVWDEAHVLRAETASLLSQALAAESEKTGNQLVIAIFRELGGEDLVDFTNRVFKAWKVGQKGKDNGVLLALYWKEHKIRMEVGYGLEPLLTDVQAKRVILAMGPELRAGRTEEAIVTAARSILTTVQSPFVKSGDFDRVFAGHFPQQEVSPWVGTPVLVICLLIIFFFVFLGRRSRSKPRGGGRYWGDGGGGGGFGGFGGGGGFGGSSSSGDSSGGGDFGGGGGSSGGGGASGDW